MGPLSWTAPHPGSAVGSVAVLFHGHPLVAPIMVVVMAVDMFVAALDMLVPLDVAMTMSVPVYGDATGADVDVLGRCVARG